MGINMTKGLLCAVLLAAATVVLARQPRPRDSQTQIAINRKNYALCAERLVTLKARTCSHPDVELLTDNVRGIIKRATGGPITVMGFKDGQISTHSYAEVQFLMKLLKNELPVENGNCPKAPDCPEWNQETADKLAFVLGADPEPDRAVAAFKHWSYDFMVKKIAQIEHHTDEGLAADPSCCCSSSFSRSIARKRQSA